MGQLSFGTDLLEGLTALVQREQITLGRIQAIGAANLCPLLDATRLIAPGGDRWGWWRYTRDRFHLSPDGHRALAEFLVQQGQRLGVWQTHAARR